VHNTVLHSQCLLENASYVDGGVSNTGATGSADVIIAPGYVSWQNGRRGFRVQLTYINGYPHAGIVASALKGTTSLSVDDCTGMAGMSMTIYDGANTEVVSVASTSTTSGPGTATLATGTQYAHVASEQAPLVISSLPSSIQQAAIFYATYITLTRGATATTVQGMPGSMSGGGGSKMLYDDAKGLLKPYRRVF